MISTSNLNLHIAMLVRSFSPYGGLELYTHKLVQGLLERDFIVTVLCEESNATFTHQNLRICKFIAPQAGLTKANRIKHYYDEITNAVDRFGPFDLVHSQHLPVKNPDVVTFHNHTVFRLSQVGFGWEKILNSYKTNYVGAYKTRDNFDRQLSQTAKTLVFTSNVCKKDFVETYQLARTNPNASYLVTYPGSDLDRTSYCQTPEESLDKSMSVFSKKNISTPLTFLFVGKGRRKKGLDILLHASQILLNRGKSFRLQIVGLDQNWLDKFQLLRLGLIGWVNYLGFQKDMETIYDHCSAIILPSRVEPFGMAPLQAMLRGLVPIVSKVSGVSEIITHQHDGLILDNHLDAIELANHMSFLLDNSVLTQTMSVKAQTKAQSLTWTMTVEAMAQAYLSLKESKDSLDVSTSIR